MLSTFPTLYPQCKFVRSLIFTSPFVRQLHHVALDGLESHTPISGPNYLNDQYPVSSTFLNPIMSKEFYMQREQQGAKNGALRSSTKFI